MRERDAFLKALAENEDDALTRSVYADWLDENGEHEEADRQRKWPAAKVWLVQFCKDHNPPRRDGHTWIISYEDLLEIGREALEEEDEDDWRLSCGNNMRMCDALNSRRREFFKNWSIVTDVPVLEDQVDRAGFSCAC
jgi:uncharacterized protein (TIGR02996 family)